MANRRSHRTPSFYGGISLLVIDNSSQNESVKSKSQLNSIDYCLVFYSTNLSRCLKYLKKIPVREYVVILFYNFHKDKVQNMISQLNQHRQIQAVFVLENPTENNDVSCQKSECKIIESFTDWQPLSTSLKQLITDKEHSLKDAGLFTLCHSPEKALRDLRQDLGSFVWTHTFRGLFEFRFE